MENGHLTIHLNFIHPIHSFVIKIFVIIKKYFPSESKAAASIPLYSLSARESV